MSAPRRKGCALRGWWASSRAFFRMILGSATVPVMPPELMTSKWSILFARFRKTTAKISCGRSRNLACRNFAMPVLLLICGFSRLSVASLRLPNSIAAAIVTAFASPMPLIFMSSLTDSLPSSTRLFLLRCMTSRPRSTADRSRVPFCMRMDSSSTSLRLAAPSSRNFSRGLSVCAHDLMGFPESALIFFSVFIGQLPAHMAFKTMFRLNIRYLCTIYVRYFCIDFLMLSIPSPHK